MSVVIIKISFTLKVKQRSYYWSSVKFDLSEGLSEWFQIYYLFGSVPFYEIWLILWLLKWIQGELACKLVSYNERRKKKIYKSSFCDGLTDFLRSFFLGMSLVNVWLSSKGVSFLSTKSMLGKALGSLMNFAPLPIVYALRSQSSAGSLSLRFLTHWVPLFLC